MALESHRYRGVVRDGKVELEKGASVPDGANVIVLFEPEDVDENGKLPWPEGFIRTLSGSLADCPIDPPEELPYEQREPFA